MTIEKLKKELENASYNYYNSDILTLSDEEFDKMKIEYEERSGEKLPIGALPEAKGKRVVNIPHQFNHLVGSLDKVNIVFEKDNIIEGNKSLENWLERLRPFVSDRIIKLLISYKFDGNSVTIEFNKGEMVQALTRGRDGEGLDVSEIFKGLTIENNTDNIGIKYEVVMLFSDFDKYNEIYEQRNDRRLANPRSAVAGILGNDDGYEFAEFLTLVPLRLSDKNKPLSRMDELEIIAELYPDNLFINSCEIINLDFCEEGRTFEDYLSCIQEINKTTIDNRAYEKEIPVLIDGLVIEILNEDIREDLLVDTWRPEHSTALKFPYMEKASKVTGFDFTLGKTNRITPRVWFESVTFNGAVQQKVSLSNYKRFQNLKLGVGSDIVVQYRNEVLSYIEPLDTENNKNIEPYEFTKTCPSCDAEISINENRTYAYCKNTNCKNLLGGRIERYLEKLNIKGVKINTLDKLIEAEVIKELPDIYKIKVSDIEGIEGLGLTSAKFIVNAITENKPKDSEILAGIGIEDFGNRNASELMKHYSLEHVVGSINKPIFISEIVANVKGFSDIKVNKLKDGINKYREELLEIMQLTDYLKTKDVNINISNKNKYTFVFSGVRDRELKELLENNGHTVTGSVSSNTDILLIKDNDSSGSKIVKAKKLNKKIIPIQEFKEKLSEYTN